MSGADRRSSQRSGQPRRRPEQRIQMGDDRDKTQRQRSAQRKRPSGSTSANGRRSANGRPSQKGRSRKRAKRGLMGDDLDIKHYRVSTTTGESGIKLWLMKREKPEKKWTLY